jgi:hypothetical protein
VRKFHNLHFQEGTTRIIAARVVKNRVVVLVQGVGFMCTTYSLKSYSNNIFARLLGGWEHHGYWEDEDTREIALAHFDDLKL